MSSTFPRDIAVLIARLGIGVIFIAHGWQKFFTNGIEATRAGFKAMEAPVPDLSAVVAATIELGGGIALVVGVLTPIAGILLALNMLGAFFIAHTGNGLFVTDGGYEYVLALGVASLLIAAVGPGKLSVDAIFGKKLPWV
ncbi:MAG: DoxX family protein [Mycobacteriaceae bacterium]